MQSTDHAFLADRYARLEHLHVGWRRQLRLGSAVRWSLRGAIFGLAAALAFSLAAVHARALPPATYVRLLVLTSGASGALAAGMALVWPCSPLAAARRLDRQLGLHERLSTAIELRQRGWPTAAGLTRLQLEDTLQACQAVQAGPSLPLQRLGRDALIAALLLAASMLLLPLGRPAFEAAARQSAFQRAVESEVARIEALHVAISEAEQIDPTGREALAQPLQTVEQRVGEAHSPEQALSALSAAEGELRQLARPQALDLADALNQTGARLSQAPDQDLAELGTQLAQGNFEAAAETLQRMELQPSTTAQAQAQARSLRAAAEMLRGTAPELAQALRDAGAALQNGDSAATRPSLDDAAQALEQINQQILQAEMAANAAEALAQAQVRLLQAAGELAEAGDAAGAAQGESQGSMTSGRADGAGSQPGQSGSSIASGQGEAGGAGRGERAAGAMQGAPSGTDPIAQGNASGDGGERPYQPLQPRSRLGDEGTLGLALAGSGEPGDLVLGTAGSAPGTDAEAHVPYTAVFGQYEATARQAIDNLQPPPYLEALVRQYFSSLVP